jgi:hypothetical protein
MTLLLVAMAAAMRVVTYNRMTLQAEGRVQDISLAFRHVDRVAAIGTKTRHKWQNLDTSWAREFQHHWACGYGWERAWGSNRSCGVIMFKKRKFSQKSATAVRVSPRCIAGRCLAIRLVSGHCDILVVAAYYPPKSMVKRT